MEHHHFRNLDNRRNAGEECEMEGLTPRKSGLRVSRCDRPWRPAYAGGACFDFHCTPSFVFAVTLRSSEGVSQCALGKELYRRVVESPRVRWAIRQARPRCKGRSRSHRIQ